MRPALFVAAIIGLSFSTSTDVRAQEWVRCASEGQQCRFAGIKMVRYGESDQFRFGTFTDGVTCSNAAFGDPVAGRRKTCWTYQTAGDVDEERTAREMRRRVDQQQLELQRRGERIAALEAEAQSREEQIGGLEFEVQQLQGTLQRRDRLVDALQTEVQSGQERISHLEAQVEQLQDRPAWNRGRGRGPFRDRFGE